MSEATIQAAIKATLQSMSQFADEDVTINNWSVRDGTYTAGPWANIVTADDIRSRQDVVVPENQYDIVVELVYPFVDWETTLNAYRDLRQAMLTAFNTATGERSPGATNADLVEIRNTSPLVWVANPNLSGEQQANADPIALLQTFVFETREY